MNMNDFDAKEALKMLDAGDPYLRQNFIGASDVPIIMGVSPYCTPYQLWQEKLGIAKRRQNNFITDKGHTKEIEARKFFEEMKSNSFPPKRFFSNEYDFLMCSLDGFCEKTSEALEIKFVGKKDLENAIKGIVPEKYIPQIQTQMHICQINQINYFSYISDKENHNLVVQYDPDYWKLAINKILDFRSKLVNKIPPELCSRDYSIKYDTHWQHVCNRFKQIQSQKKEIEEEETILRNEIIRLCDGNNCEGFGVRSKKVTKKGVIDYSKIEELKSIDIERYRKEETEYWKISIDEDLN